MWEGGQVSDEGIGPEPRMEEMGEFFDARVAGYDAHLATTFPVFVAEGYRAVAHQIPAFQGGITILSLGSGSGAELIPNTRASAPAGRDSGDRDPQRCQVVAVLRAWPFGAKLTHQSCTTSCCG
jgi:hypothetical protein